MRIVELNSGSIESGAMPSHKIAANMETLHSGRISLDNNVPDSRLRGDRRRPISRVRRIHYSVTDSRNQTLHISTEQSSWYRHIRG